MTPTPDGFAEDVDLDRLADYHAGALGAAEAAEVSALLATDPRWERAYAALVSADDLIRGALRAEATARIEPMPADVVARVEDALAAVRSHESQPSATVISIGNRRRRTQKILAGIAGGIAAAFALVVGINLTSGLQTMDAATTMGDAESAGSPPNMASPPPAFASTRVAITASGANYAQDTLGGFGRLLATDSHNPSLAPPTSAPETLAPQSPGEPGRSAAPPVVPFAVGKSAAQTPLSRLAEPSALGDCLATIVVTHPGTVIAVDFARYEGQSALVVLVRGQTGEVILAVGQDCGLDGPDIKGISVR